VQIDNLGHHRRRAHHYPWQIIVLLKFRDQLGKRRCALADMDCTRKRHRQTLNRIRPWSADRAGQRALPMLTLWMSFRRIDAILPIRNPKRMFGFGKTIDLLNRRLFGQALLSQFAATR